MRALHGADDAGVEEEVDAVDPDDLADDHSAADVWTAIEALGEGDGTRAGLSYRRANARWITARQRESMN